MIRYFIIIIAELIWWDWQLVGTFETDVKYKADAYHTDTFDVFIHCFESRWGTRYTRLVIQRFPSFLGITTYFLKKKIKRAKLYQTEIYPWLKERRHDKIPSYEKVRGGKWDFMKKLKGLTAVVLNDDEK